MALLAEVAHRAGVLPIRRGSLELIAFEDAERLLDSAASANVTVIGVEGFQLCAGRAVPAMNAIADFSGLGAIRDAALQSVRNARRFVLEVGRPGMYFDVVLAPLRATSNESPDGDPHAHLRDVR